MLLSALAAAPALLGGCSYELKGRVVERDFDSVQMLAADDPTLEQGTPVTGARLVLTRDPGSLGRKDVASAVSDRGGWFTLRLSDAGAGFTEEMWGLRVQRTGFGGAEDVVELPFDPAKSRVLVTLVPGPARRGAERGAGAEVRSDVDRFVSSPGGRSP